ncbi:MAG TPA: DNA internalization-related competence protein ComEC/Rec2 [Anaerohalosphaeraceae bacterium]|nr:DNA internalization-related competence protein ComEC/Rec2 [Anaerohalosphaeraceae bacterium]HOL89444.1 DNA internalization-related competence protein ComEC/Rec2 [Anaerohalosphaeraceae bacterium]HPP56726.1 DNA internalization-related competence protein ComEC/Rec2 [Anaerohalosphaeraceae bacterium]
MKNQRPQADPIRLEIEALQNQLKEKRPFAEQILQSCPLLPAAAGFMAGLILQNYTNPPLFGWFFTLILLAVFSVFAGKIRRQPRRLQVILLTGSLTALTTGGIRLKLFQTPYPSDIRRKMASAASLATLEGMILTEPHIEDRRQWVFAKYQWTSPSTSFLLAVEKALTTDGWQRACGTLAVSVNQPIRTLSAGVRIRFHCTLQKPPPPDNPGMVDYGETLAAQGIFLTAEIPGPEALKKMPQDKKGRRLFAIQQFRSRIAQSLRAWGGEYEEFSSLPDALLLGKRSGLNTTIQTAFRKTGLAHFISLSGMHVGILAGILWQAGRLFGLSKRFRAIPCVFLLLAYAILVPPRAPTLRAVVFAQFYLLSVLLCRHPRPLNTLCLTVLVLLLFRPMDLFTAGWQLSYASVAGILFFYEPIFLNLFRLFLKVPFYRALSGSFVGSFVCVLFESVVKLLSVGYAAWLGGAGILLYHFGSFTPLSALWTVLLFPFVFVIVLTGFLKILLLPMLPTAAALCSVLLDWVSDAFCTLTVKIAESNIFSYQIGRVGLGLILLYYGWLILARGLPAGTKGKSALLWTGTALLLLLPPVVRFSRLLSTDFKLTCLSVGHGLAVVGQLPGGKTFLFDAGSITRKNPGSRIVVPFLLRQGIETIDAVVLSHGDLDHYNGMPEILSSIPAKAVYVNPGFLERAEHSRAAALMKNILTQEDLLHSSMELPSSLGAVRLHRLWPIPSVLEDPSVSDNNKSEVLLLEYAGRTVLLCGDIEESAQRQLGQLVPDLKVDVLLLPHHGSGRNNLPGWIRQIQPSVRLVSCAQRRLSSVLTLDDTAADFYTPGDGAVTITIKADGTLSAVGFLKP